MADPSTFSLDDAWSNSTTPAAAPPAPAPAFDPNTAPLDLSKARPVQRTDTPAPDVGPGFYRDAGGTLFRVTTAPAAAQSPVASAPQATPAAAAPGAFSINDAWPGPPVIPQRDPTLATVAGQGARGAVGSLDASRNVLLNTIGNPLDALNHIADITDPLANLIGAASGDPNAEARFQAEQPPSIPAALVGGMSVQSVPSATVWTPPDVTKWLAEPPQNEPERLARSVGTMAPAALMPSDLPGVIPQLASRTAAVVLPAVASESARAGVEAMGGDQDAQNLAAAVGAIGGGAASRIRIAAPSADAPPIPEPLADVAPGSARRAAAYVASRSPPVSIPQIAEAADAGKPVILAQRMGNSGTLALGSLARRPGATGDALDAYAADPQTGVIATQPARLQGDFQAATGINPAAAAGDIEGLVTSLREGPAKEAYDRALGTPENPNSAPVWNAKLAALAQRPVIQRAMAAAADSLRNAGKDPNQVGLAIDPNTGAPVQGTDLGATTQQQPTAEAWDLTKQMLGKMVERDPFGRVVRSGASGITNGNIATASTDLTSALKDAIPGYNDALAKAGDYLSLQKAFQDGQTHMATGVDSRAVTKYVSGLSPAEKTAYAGGVANKLFELADNGRLAPKTYSTPAFQAKLAAAVGPDAASKILTGARQEAAISSSLREAMPNSGPSTAKFGSEMASQDQPPEWVKHGTEFVVNSALAGPHVAATKLGMGIVGKVPQIASRPFQMSEVARDAAGRLLMSPTATPEDLAAYAEAMKNSKARLRMAPIVPQINAAQLRPQP